MRASSHFLWLEGYKLLDVASKCFTTSDVVGKQFRENDVKVIYQDGAHGAEPDQRLLGLCQVAEVVNDLVFLCCCSHCTHSIQLVLGHFQGLGENWGAAEEMVNPLQALAGQFVRHAPAGWSRKNDADIGKFFGFGKRRKAHDGIDARVSHSGQLLRLLG